MTAHWKGRVERAIRYIRDNFFAARAFSDLDDLNQQARHWCKEVAAKRPCPDDTDLSVAEAFEAEKNKLLALPDTDFDFEHQDVVKIGKTPWARFDLNDYSVPHTQVRKSLNVRATEKQVRFFDAEKEVAAHPRCWDRQQQIENPEHTRDLRAYKKAAATDHATSRLTGVCAEVAVVLEQQLQRKQSLSKTVRALQSLLDDYGATEFSSAIKIAVEREIYHAPGVRQVLEQRREDKNQPPQTPIRLPEKAHVQVKPADLAQYDLVHDERSPQSLNEKEDS